MWRAGCRRVGGQRGGQVRWQDLCAKKAGDFGLVGQRREQRLDETKTYLPGGGHQLQRRHIRVIGPHLTVTNHPVARELEPCDAKLG
jgi:hypothetical protein